MAEISADLNNRVPELLRGGTTVRLDALNAIIGELLSPLKVQRLRREGVQCGVRHEMGPRKASAIISFFFQGNGRIAQVTWNVGPRALRIGTSVLDAPETAKSANERFRDVTHLQSLITRAADYVKT